MCIQVGKCLRQWRHLLNAYYTTHTLTGSQSTLWLGAGTAGCPAHSVVNTHLWQSDMATIVYVNVHTYIAWNHINSLYMYTPILLILSNEVRTLQNGFNSQLPLVGMMPCACLYVWAYSWAAERRRGGGGGGVWNNTGHLPWAGESLNHKS